MTEPFEDYCYECTGYGDDYYYDPEKDEDVCACDECPNDTDDGCTLHHMTIKKMVRENEEEWAKQWDNIKF